MSLALIQGYSSAEEEENDRFSQNSSEEDDQNDVAYAPLSRPIGDKPSFHFPTASSGSALPSAFDAFSELSSLPNLINLSIGDTVLTNGGLNSFKPPATLKLLDLRGCWLLTEDAILSFHKNDPQIEVRHELVHITPSEQNASNRSSPSQKGKKQQKLPKSQSRSKEETVIDQRWKYSREELLAMEHSTLALNFPYKMHLG